MSRSGKPRQKVAHGFVVEALAPLDPEVRRLRARRYMHVIPMNPLNVAGVSLAVSCISMSAQNATLDRSVLPIAPAHY